ncbi:hypothetical protein [Bifidobacterium sp.]|uniref:hypothetical protein n=1 Tax=Bifidobacterium sp. TaxID=41200 RepID=UPI0039EB2C43
MPKTKKSVGTLRKAGKIQTTIELLNVLSQFINQDTINTATTWWAKQDFSAKFTEIIKKIYSPETKNPLEATGHWCDAVEELIETKSADLSDDAPISQWREEMDKIRRGVELINNSLTKDRKQIKTLEVRAKKLFDSAFKAAIN